MRTSPAARSELGCARGVEAAPGGGGVRRAGGLQPGLAPGSAGKRERKVLFAELQGGQRGGLWICARAEAL